MTEIKTLPSYLTVKNQIKDQSADMYIDGEIVSEEYEDSDVSAVGFRDALKQLGDIKQLNLYINSPGGDVFQGIAIYNMLKRNKAKVNIYVDGVAASIASVIAMAGDTIFMPSNSMLMIHNPYTMAIGNANELRKAADDMDQITKASKQSYLDKAGDKLTDAKLQEIMDNETWLTAQEAVDYGLADEVLEPVQAVASINNPFAKNFKHIPKELLADVKENADKKAQDQEWRKKLKAQLSEFDDEDFNLQLKNLKEKIIND